MFFLYFIYGVIIFYLFHYFLRISILLILIISWREFNRKRYINILFLLSGILYAFLRYHEPLQIDFNDNYYLYGRFGQYTVNHNISSLSYREEFFVKECNIKPCPDKVSLILDKPYPVAHLAEIDLKIKTQSLRLVPGILNQKVDYTGYPDGIILKGEEKDALSFFETQREKLHALFLSLFDRDVSTFLSAVVTGIRDINDGLAESFRKTGLSHLLSISGTHFGLLSFISFLVVKKTIKCLPYRLLHVLTTNVSLNMISALVTIPLNVFYLMLSGFKIPVLRSFIMVTLFLIGMLSERRSYWLNALIFAGFIIVFINPEALFDISFILSFSAVYFIGLTIDIFLAEVKSVEFSPILTGLFKWIKNSFFISAGATIGTLPLVMYFFNYIPLLAIFTNLTITPLVCFVILPLILLSSFIYLVTGVFLFERIIAFLTGNIIDIIRYIASLRYSDLPVSGFPLIIVFLLYVVILSLIYRRRIIALFSIFTLIVIFSFNYLSREDVSVTFLDVGQGESTVIDLPDGRIFVVDTGRSGYEVKQYLRYLGKKEIDVLILSHVHEDHTGGIMRLKKSFTIREVWDNGMIFYPDGIIEGITKRSLTRGDLIRGKDYVIEVLYPYEGYYSTSGSEYDEENNSSLVFRFGYKGKYILFTGDIEDEAMDELNHLPLYLSANILKVPHHGSRVSVNTDFFDHVRPEISIISAGRDNPFGHPHSLLFDVLNYSLIYRTDRDGSVKVCINNQGINVKIMKNYVFQKGYSIMTEMMNLINLFRKF